MLKSSLPGFYLIIEVGGEGLNIWEKVSELIGEMSNRVWVSEPMVWQLAWLSPAECPEEREQVDGFILAEVVKRLEGKETWDTRMPLKWCLVGSTLKKEGWNKNAGGVGKVEGDDQTQVHPSLPLWTLPSYLMEKWVWTSSWFLRHPWVYRPSPDTTVICIYDTQLTFLAPTICCQRICKDHQNHTQI